MLRTAAAKREPHVAAMIKASIKNTAVSKFVRNEQQLEEIVLRMKQASPAPGIHRHTVAPLTSVTCLAQRRVHAGEVVIAEGTQVRPPLCALSESTLAPTSYVPTHRAPTSTLRSLESTRSPSRGGASTTITTTTRWPGPRRRELGGGRRRRR